MFWLRWYLYGNDNFAVKNYIVGSNEDNIQQ